MYHAHFGLTESPFGITPNPAFFYSGNTRGEILQALLYVVTHGEGIIKVTGEVGSGKTMLCRMLEEQLPPHIEVIYLVNPSLSPQEALFAIASELGITPDGKRSDEVLRLLHTDLIAKHSAGRQVVLLVEEAQAMPLETLEEVRLLTNLETARHKLLQIVLFGQPELDQHLDLASMRQLKERITHSFEVPAMATELIPEFLAFRLRAAGHHGPDIFSGAAAKLIGRASQGIVRRINILADKALLAAFADDAATVDVRHVQQAARESAFGRPGGRRTGAGVDLVTGATAAMAMLIVVLLAAIAWLLMRPQATLPGPRPTTPQAAPTMAPAVSPQPAIAAPPAPSVTSATSAASASSPPLMQASSQQQQQQQQPVPASVTGAAPPVAPAAQPQVQPQVQPAAPDSLLQRSLRATKVWLRDAPASNLCVEIATLPATDHVRLDQFLRSAQDAVGVGQVHAYPLRRDGASAIAIVYGNYASRAEAKATQTLLEQRWSYRPQLRDIASIRADVTRAGASDLW